MPRHYFLKFVTFASDWLHLQRDAQIRRPNLGRFRPDADYEIDHGAATGTLNRKIAETFAVYDDVATSIVAAKEFQLFEGLPHHVWESKLHQAELERAKTVEIAANPSMPHLWKSRTMLPTICVH